MHARRNSRACEKKEIVLRLVALRPVLELLKFSGAHSARYALLLTRLTNADLGNRPITHTYAHVAYHRRGAVNRDATTSRGLNNDRVTSAYMKNARDGTRNPIFLSRARSQKKFSFSDDGDAQRDAS